MMSEQVEAMRKSFSGPCRCLTCMVKPIKLKPIIITIVENPPKEIISI